MGKWGSPSPSEHGDWSFGGSPPTAIIYTLTWVSERAIALTAMASSHNTIALMAPWVMCCMSSVEQTEPSIPLPNNRAHHGVSMSQSYAYFHDVLP